MKRLLILSLLLLLLTGCSIDNTPIQAVVDRYKTTDIKPYPYNSSHFFVKDTNGAIWFVETQTGGLTSNHTYSYYCVRNTLLFDSVKKVDKIKLEE